MTNDDTVRFGDDEPEDAWDPDDSVDELIRNLIRRAALEGVQIREPRDSDDPADVIRELSHATQRVQREGFADDVREVALRMGFEDYD